MLTPEVRKELAGFLVDEEMPSKNPFWKNSKLKDDDMELPLNEPKALPSNDDDNKEEDKEAWN